MNVMMERFVKETHAAMTWVAVNGVLKTCPSCAPPRFVAMERTIVAASTPTDAKAVLAVHGYVVHGIFFT